MMQICGEMQELDSQGTLSLQQLAGEPSAVGGTVEVFGKEDSGWATARSGWNQVCGHLFWVHSCVPRLRLLGNKWP